LLSELCILYVALTAHTGHIITLSENILKRELRAYFHEFCMAGVGYGGNLVIYLPAVI